MDHPDATAALEYSTRTLGISLATIHVQHGTDKTDAQKALLALARFAKANQLIIYDPQLDAQVDLEDPGKRPVKR